MWIFNKYIYIKNLVHMIVIFIIWFIWHMKSCWLVSIYWQGLVESHCMYCRSNILIPLGPNNHSHDPQGLVIIGPDLPTGQPICPHWSAGGKCMRQLSLKVVNSTYRNRKFAHHFMNFTLFDHAKTVNKKWQFNKTAVRIKPWMSNYIPLEIWM